MDESAVTQQASAVIVSNSEPCPGNSTEEPGDGNFDKTSSETQIDENGNPALFQFSQQLARILSDVESKIKAESSNLNASLSSDMTVALQREREQHLREKKELLQEIKSLYKLIDSLESTVEKKTMLTEKIIEKFIKQRDLLMCSKAFHSWKLFLNNKKHEEHRKALAVHHYEVNLKRKAFQWWQAQVKARWKNRLELRAHMDVIEMQKRITNLYETKIRDLEDNLSEAGKAINNLQSQQATYSDVPLCYSSDYQHLNLNAPITLPKELPTFGAAVSKAPPRTTSLDSSLCPQCVIEQKNCAASYTSVPSSHPFSSLAARLPLGGDQQRERHAMTQAVPMYFSGSASFPNLCRKEPSDHMPKGGRLVTHHPQSCAKPASRPQSSKTYRDKKVV